MPLITVKIFDAKQKDIYYIAKETGTTHLEAIKYVLKDLAFWNIPGNCEVSKIITSDDGVECLWDLKTLTYAFAYD